MRIYIAGPYTAPTREGIKANVARADDVARELLLRGHTPFTPHKQTFDWQLDERLSYDDCLCFDIQWLRVCDALFFIESSPGADRELQLAETLGLLVYRSLDEVPLGERMTQQHIIPLDKAAMMLGMEEEDLRTCIEAAGQTNTDGMTLDQINLMILMELKGPEYARLLEEAERNRTRFAPQSAKDRGNSSSFSVWLFSQADDDYDEILKDEIAEAGLDWHVRPLGLPSEGINAAGRPDVILFDLGVVGVGSTNWDAQLAATRWLLDRYTSAWVFVFTGMGFGYATDLIEELRGEDARIVALNFDEPWLAQIRAVVRL